MKETPVCILWVSLLTLPQKTGEIVVSDGDMKQPNLFVSPAQDNIRTMAP